MKKILFLVNIPSPYRVNFFNELGKYCDLTVLFELSSSDERDEIWKKYSFKNFNGIFLKGKKKSVHTAFCKDVKKYIKDNSYDRIICANYSTPTGMYAIFYMKLHHIKYYLEADGAFKGTGKGVKEKVKKFLIKGADGYFSSSKTTDEYYKFYGAKNDRIYRYPFTSLYKKDIIDRPLNDEEKQSLRDKLGIREKQVVLTVGQFIYRKGFDILLRACTQISKEVGIYFVGGVPTDEYKRFVQEKDLSQIHFIAFKNKEDLKEYYKMTDVFVLPTREDIWGLVINEAMACGLPIITTDKCIAGLELVENEKNGYIIPVGDDKTLAEKIDYILSNEKTKKEMSKISIEKIKNYTIENMAKEHVAKL